MVVLNFLYHVGSIGRGVRRLLVLVKFLHPRYQVLLTDLFDESCTQNVDIVPGLCHINTIIHVQVPLPFHRDKELIINFVQKDISGTFVRGGDREVINLSFKDYSFALNHPGIKTQFMDCRS
jgi:hypothetical protein